MDELLVVGSFLHLQPAGDFGFIAAGEMRGFLGVYRTKARHQGSAKSRTATPGERGGSVALTPNQVRLNAG